MTLAFHFLRDHEGIDVLADAFALEGRPLESPGLYTTSFVDLYLVQSGNARFRETPGEWLGVSAGDVVVGRMHVPKEWERVERLRGATLLFDGRFFEQFLRDPFFAARLSCLRPEGTRVFSLGHERIGSLVQRAMRIRSERTRWGPGSRELVQALAHSIIAEVEREHLLARNTSPLPVVVERFLALVERDFRSRHRVEEHAAELGVSRAHLSRLCMGSLGRQPSHIIKDRLVAEAKLRILSSGEPLTRIAAELGFRDATEFHRFFRARTGVAPGAIRARSSGLQGAGG